MATSRTRAASSGWSAPAPRIASHASFCNNSSPHTQPRISPQRRRGSRSSCRSPGVRSPADQSSSGLTGEPSSRCRKLDSRGLASRRGLSATLVNPWTGASAQRHLQVIWSRTRPPIPQSELGCAHETCLGSLLLPADVAEAPRSLRREEAGLHQTTPGPGLRAPLRESSRDSFHIVAWVERARRDREGEFPAPPPTKDTSVHVAWSHLQLLHGRVLLSPERSMASSGTVRQGRARALGPRGGRYYCRMGQFGCEKGLASSMPLVSPRLGHFCSRFRFGALRAKTGSLPPNVACVAPRFEPMYLRGT